MGTLLLRAGSIGAALLCMAGGVAAADLPVADVSKSAVSADGWQLTATLKNMTFNPVPNMAATAFTREAFVSGQAEARIDGSGSAPVNSGSLILGMQLGCQIDLSWGGTLGLGQSAIPFAPNINLLLLPGWIANVGLGRIPLKGRIATINVHDVEIKVDACGGPANARFFATTLINSDTSQDSQTVYGDIISI
ncbi:MAG TPA: MspA family porin [Mycobacterium sp.]|nr:MspA family porin [Mycobacterium sp.]